jgi:hypothetical protein
MARARKKDESEAEKAENADPRLGDDIRRFVSYAADLIDSQEKAATELAAAREALERTSQTHERVSKAVAIRERDGITVRLEGDIDDARRRIRAAIAEPVERAERIAREARMTAALSGLAGGIIGGTLIALLLIFDLI